MPTLTQTIKIALVGNPNVGKSVIFHYLTGALVAVLYPIGLLLFQIPIPQDHLMYTMIFGLLTSVFPWFIVYPSFGVGFFGTRAPKEAKPVLTSLVSHTFYGLGIGVFINLMM